MNELFKYYKIIGELHTLVSRVDSLDKALRAGLSKIQESFNFDVSALWYQADGKIIRPFYWHGAYDLTSKTHKIDEGFVGKCIAKGEPIRMLTYKKGMDAYSDEDFEKEIISNLIIPITNNDDIIGCIQFVMFAGSEPIDEETADVCDIMANMFSLALTENEHINARFKFDKILLSARDVNKKFQSGDGYVHVLKGVNLDIYEGEFLVLLGESGCGKSTFLNIIGGMDKLDSGTYTFMGNDMSIADKEMLTEYRRNNIGFVFQSYNLMPNLTAKQNLDMIAELVDNPLDSEEVLELVGLSEKLNNYPSKLSGGQQQRVSIARALVKRPKIIFADEPTAALDYTTSIEVLSVFEKVVKTGTTLVMVTHNEEITKMANRVIRFRDGKNYETIINRNPVHATELVW